MFAAPPVQVTLPDGRRERLAAAFVWATAGTSLCAWLMTRLANDAPLALVVLAVVLVCVVSGWLTWRLGRPLVGTLAWNGQSWLWAPTGQWPGIPVGPVSKALELGNWILLRIGSGQWCGVHANDAGVHWHGLKLALRNSAVATPSRVDT